MRKGIPLAYTLFRALWTVLHLSLVCLALGIAIAWFLRDGQGIALSVSIWTTLTDLQTTVANAIPFPWGL